MRKQVLLFSFVQIGEFFETYSVRFVCFAGCSADTALVWYAWGFQAA